MASLPSPVPPYSSGTVKPNTPSSAKPVTKKLIVTAAKDFDLSPPTVESELEYLSFDVKEIRKGKQYQISAVLDPSGAPEGQFRKNISIKTNSKEYGANDIPVFAHASTGEFEYPLATIPTRSGRRSRRRAKTASPD